MDIEKLRELALKATPGPWQATCWEEPQWAVGPGKYQFVAVTSQANDEANATYIAACDPQTILALIEENDEAAKLLQSFAPLCDDDSPVRKWLARRSHQEAGR
jgi:hypothetical protein